MALDQGVIARSAHGALGRQPAFDFAQAVATIATRLQRLHQPDARHFFHIVPKTSSRSDWLVSVFVPRHAYNGL